MDAAFVGLFIVYMEYSSLSTVIAEIWAKGELTKKVTGGSQVADQTGFKQTTCG